MTKVYLDSSVLEWMEYDPITLDMWIGYLTGKVQRFAKVPQQKYNHMYELRRHRGRSGNYFYHNILKDYQMMCPKHNCIFKGNHGDSPHISNIVLETQPGLFKWRIYWTDEDWGAYICDEAGEKFDFHKYEGATGGIVFREIARAMGVLQ